MSQWQETPWASVYFAVAPFKNRFHFISFPAAAIFLQRVLFIAQLSQNVPTGGEFLRNKAVSFRDT